MRKSAPAGFLFSLLLLGVATPVSQVQPEPPAVRTAVICITGDLMVHQEQLSAARLTDKSYRFDSSFGLILPALSNADLAFGNLETVIGSAKTGYSGYPQFKTPASFLSALKSAGFDLLTTANNHSFDAGPAGIDRTLAALDSAGIPATGTRRDSLAPRMIFFPVNGIRLGLIASSYGINGTLPLRENWRLNLNDTTFYQNILTELDRLPDSLKPDFLIASLHWGEEYALKPSEKQKTFARWLVNHGIDLVSGSHPHVIQPADSLLRTNGRDTTAHLVFYSLGNFISAQRTWPRAVGTVLSLKLQKDILTRKTRITDFELTPTWVEQDMSKTESRYRIYPAGAGDTLSVPLRIKPNLKKARTFVQSQVGPGWSGKVK